MSTLKMAFDILAVKSRRRGPHRHDRDAGGRSRFDIFRQIDGFVAIGGWTASGRKSDHDAFGQTGEQKGLPPERMT